MYPSKLRAYRKQTKRPIYSAALILPFFLIYHGGILVLQATYINGADALIMRILGMFSVHTMFASALVLLASFIFWQIRSKASWKIQTSTLLLTYLESCFFAVLLFVLLGWSSYYLASHAPAAAASGPRFRGKGHLVEMVLYCGAGIYEELLFRGILLGSLILCFGKVFPLKKRGAAIWGTLVASLLFSLFHYIGPGSDSFAIGSFVQRFLAGIYFSALFVWRSFGVTAAAHSLYDILVGLLRL
jgi:membrane protease YdiL (CAAX protease family)